MTRRLAVSPPCRLAASSRGTTLIELIVVLAIVALLFGVAVPALTSSPPGAGLSSVVDSLRLAAIASGSVAHRDAHDTTEALTALPDGRVIGEWKRDAR